MDMTNDGIYIEIIEVMGTIYYASFQGLRVASAVTVWWPTVSKDMIGYTSETLSPFD
jgi:hypothetical protein